ERPLLDGPLLLLHLRFGGAPNRGGPRPPGRAGPASAPAHEVPSPRQSNPMIAAAWSRRLTPSILATASIGAPSAFAFAPAQAGIERGFTPGPHRRAAFIVAIRIMVAAARPSSGSSQRPSPIRIGSGSSSVI